MSPKKNARGRGRSVQKRQDEDRPEKKIIEKESVIADRERDVPSPSSSSSVDVVPETQHEVTTETPKELSSEEEPTVQQKKRIRVSKKEIAEYQWTDEGTRKLSEYVKDHPMLFDKDWLNAAAKSQLWKLAGEQQEPPATGAQCKKLYENTRTRVGKIMNKENKSGAGQPERSMLSKADSMGHTPTFSGHRRIVHDFTCLLEGHMLAIPEDSWHDFEIDCLKLVQRFRQLVKPCNKSSNTSSSSSNVKPGSRDCSKPGSHHSSSSSSTLNHGSSHRPHNLRMPHSSRFQPGHSGHVPLAGTKWDQLPRHPIQS